ncbi:MAG: glycosyltransferase family 2 protein [Carnobacterium sp.]|uniref:glycosyltransferase family 2 protein n=1 Tax=Carnobacterium sp. TaxID=48221 RepID=UPI003C78109A
MKISVCMASYNGGLYIKEQILSILKQLGKEDELIISDDGSSDTTSAIVQEINDSRVNFILNNGKKGYTKNFENALEKASGDVIFLSDQDDVWVDNKVKVMLSHLEISDMVVSNATIVDSQLKVIAKSHFHMYNVKKGFWNNFLKTRYIGACMAFKRKVLDKALPFPENPKYCAHDYWLTIVGEAFYKISIEEVPLLLYRRHGKNASNGGNKSQNPLLFKVYVRIYTLFNLLKRMLRK